MRNRKFFWLTLMTLPGVAMTGCWGAAHQLAIHGFEIVNFLASLTILGTPIV